MCIQLDLWKYEYIKKFNTKENLLSFNFFGKSSIRFVTVISAMENKNK